MVQKLEDIKGGGGSIRVGTTGTISSLITREMQSRNHAPQTPASSSKKPSVLPVSVPSGVTTSTRSSQPRKTSNEASSSSSSRGSSTNRISQRIHETTPRARQNTRKSTHTLPMLGSDDIALQRTPTRTNSNKKITHIVEVVDIKCGNTGKPHKAWSTPISSRLKKLGFSKLSVTMG